jgi:hypothetical protein
MACFSSWLRPSVGVYRLSRNKSCAPPRMIWCASAPSARLCPLAAIDPGAEQSSKQARNRQRCALSLRRLFARLLLRNAPGRRSKHRSPPRSNRRPPPIVLRWPGRRSRPPNRRLCRRLDTPTRGSDHHHWVIGLGRAAQPPSYLTLLIAHHLDYTPRFALYYFWVLEYFLLHADRVLFLTRLCNAIKLPRDLRSRWRLIAVGTVDGVLLRTSRLPARHS